MISLRLRSFLRFPGMEGEKFAEGRKTIPDDEATLGPTRRLYHWKVADGVMYAGESSREGLAGAWPAVQAIVQASFSDSFLV